MSSVGFLRIPVPAGDPAFYDANLDKWLTRGQLIESVEALAERLRCPNKALCFVFGFNDSDGLIGYLAAIHTGHAVVTLNPELDPVLTARMVATFRPDFIVAPTSHCPRLADYTAAVSPQPGQTLLRLREPVERTIHPDITLLLSTSGSTGSPKLVRLSWANLESNAAQIRHAVGITAADCAMVTSPIFNGFGQSMIHTALAAGGSFALSRSRVISPEFWDSVRTAGCNQIGGTPYFYEALDRLDLDSLKVPRLLKFIQSGGRLPERLAVRFHHATAKRGGQLQLMYGQAEATARISGLQPEFLPEAARSVGKALQGGRLWVEDDGRPCNAMEEGELFYQGPNVMMGYATCSEDLAKGNVQGDRLATGDLGYCDDRGLFYITGRRTRFAKVFGWRVSLDDVEELLSGVARVAAVNENDRIIIYTEETGAGFAEHVAQLAGTLRLHPSAFQLRPMAALPRLANGKLDYRSLTAAPALMS